MQTIGTVAELRRPLIEIRRAGKRVGFVPTMGYLHDGHLALIEASKGQSDHAISSAMKNCAEMPGSPSSLLRMQRKSIRLNFKLLLSQASSQNHSAARSDWDFSVVLRLSSASCFTCYSQMLPFSGKRTSSSARSFAACQLTSIFR